MEFNVRQGLPVAPSGTRLRTIRFTTCPGSSLDLHVAKDVDGTLDERHGVPKDAWWCVEDPGSHMIRYLRLFDGSRSLADLVLRYGFLDSKGCLHHDQAVAEHAPATTPLPEVDLSVVPSFLHDARGVPQFYFNSGVCWYASICWCFFSSPVLRDWLTGYMPDKMRHLVERCLYDREAAQSLRNMWWNEYQVGDDVSLPPEEDGRNGFLEWTVLCAKLKIPLVRYEMSDDGRSLYPLPMTVRDAKGKGNRVTVHLPRNNERHLLVLRYNDGNHRKHPILRRVEHGGHRYRFMGVVAGQRKCGHQIAWSSINGKWRCLAAGDADLHKSGIGPLYILMQGPEWNEEEDWWRGNRGMLHVTKFGPGRNSKCNHNPWNECDNLLDGGCKLSDKPGMNSLDVVYFSCEDC